MVVLSLAAGLTFAVFETLADTSVEYSSYTVFKDDLDLRWGFLLNEDENDEASIAPVWLGEFGTNSNSRWWQHMVRYLCERQVSWSYWPANGEKWIGQDETFGLLNADMET